MRSTFLAVVIAIALLFALASPAFGENPSRDLGVASAFLFHRFEERLLDGASPSSITVASWLLMKDTLNAVVSLEPSLRARLYDHAFARMTKLDTPEALRAEMGFWRTAAGLPAFTPPEAGKLTLDFEAIDRALATISDPTEAAKLRRAFHGLPRRLALDAPPGGELPLVAALLSITEGQRMAVRLLQAVMHGEVEVRAATAEERQRWLSGGTLAITVDSSLLAPERKLTARHKTLLHSAAMPLALLMPLFAHEAIHATDAERERVSSQATAFEKSRARYLAERKAYDGETRVVERWKTELPGYGALLDFYREHALFHRLPVSDAWIVEKYGISPVAIPDSQPAKSLDLRLTTTTGFSNRSDGRQTSLSTVLARQ